MIPDTLAISVGLISLLLPTLALVKAAKGLDELPGEAVLMDACAVFTDNEDVGCPDAKIDRREGGSNWDVFGVGSASMLGISGPPGVALRGVLS